MHLILRFRTSARISMPPISNYWWKLILSSFSLLFLFLLNVFTFFLTSLEWIFQESLPYVAITTTVAFINIVFSISVSFSWNWVLLWRYRQLFVAMMLILAVPSSHTSAVIVELGYVFYGYFLDVDFFDVDFLVKLLKYLVYPLLSELFLCESILFIVFGFGHLNWTFFEVFVCSYNSNYRNDTPAIFTYVVVLCLIQFFWCHVDFWFSWIHGLFVFGLDNLRLVIAARASILFNLAAVSSASILNKATSSEHSRLSIWNVFLLFGVIRRRMLSSAMMNDAGLRRFLFSTPLKKGTDFEHLTSRKLFNFILMWAFW